MVCALEEWQKESGGCRRRNGRWEEGREGKDRRYERQSERVRGKREGESGGSNRGDRQEEKGTERNSEDFIGTHVQGLRMN